MIIEKLEDLPKDVLGDWEEISQFQKLSEDFIRDHKDEVDWWGIVPRFRWLFGIG